MIVLAAPAASTAAVAVTSQIPSVLQQTSQQFWGVVAPVSQPLFLGAVYMFGANWLYLARRSYLRQFSMRKLWDIRTTREPGVSFGLHLTFLLVWQILVLVFPILEPLAVGLAKRVCFFYSYPNASGCGIIFEPLKVQHLGANQRTKHQFRLDWHRFSLNTGNVGREGYRHPPTVECNLPHIDFPEKGLKHWPWRRKHWYKANLKSNGELSSSAPVRQNADSQR